MVRLCFVSVLLQWTLQNKEGQTNAINETDFFFFFFFLRENHVIKSLSKCRSGLILQQIYQSVSGDDHLQNLASLLSVWKTNTVVSDRTLKMPVLYLKSIFLSQHSRAAYYCNNSPSHFQL